MGRGGVERGYKGGALLAVRQGPRSWGPSGLHPSCDTTGGVALDRVVGGRSDPDQVLALDDARGHLDGDAGAARQGPLEDRAGLRGTQAGVRALPLRGTGLAGIPPPRHPLHRCLRVPGGREDPPFPPLGVSRSYKHLNYPKVSDPEVLLVRPERHIHSSIGTFRLPLARGWLEDHSCGWCGRFPEVAGCL